MTIGGPSASDGVTVSGANDTGIFVDEAADVTIQNDTVQNNGVAPGSGIASFGGILIAGASGAVTTMGATTGDTEIGAQHTGERCDESDRSASARGR